MASFNATFQTSNNLNAAFGADPVLSAQFGVTFERAEYEGPYTVVPGAVTQVLNTRGFAMAEDVIVEAIPSNYGLITWNGTTLTVS